MPPGGPGIVVDPSSPTPATAPPALIRPAAVPSLMMTLTPEGMELPEMNRKVSVSFLTLVSIVSLVKS